VKVVAIIQARMGSTRLPDKVLQDIGGETMLARVVRRTQRARLLDQIVVATTIEASDDAIMAECDRLGVPVFRGDEQDVLDRYYHAAEAYDAEAVVRITSDCPFIDPEMVDQVIRAFLDEKPDYAGNTLVRAYPRGVIPEIMAMSTLARAWREATESYQRVHVTPYIYQNPGSFHLLPLMGEVDLGDYRWTVDTPEDLEFARAVYACLGNNDSFGWLDVLELLTQKPELMKLNRHVKQKTLEEG
jgi:spore coat polysaccharide biosynthesis protein SpsF